MYTHIFPYSELTGPRSSDIPVAMGTPRALILVSNTILQLKEPRLIGEMAGSRARAEKDKKRLEPLVIIEIKEVHTHTHTQSHSHTAQWWVHVKETQEPIKRAPRDQSWNNLRNKINNMVLDYNPKYKTTIESMLI